MTAVRISGTFKKDERPENGLESIAPTLVKNELARHVIVGVVELHKVTKEPGEAPVPTVRFVAIEPLEGFRADDALILLNGARDKRGMVGIPATLFDENPATDRPVWDPDTDPDLLQLAEERAAGLEAEAAQGNVDHEGATVEYADELAEMKKDLGVLPTTCAVCTREIHYDPARDGYVDGEGWTDGAEDGGHAHTPAERAAVTSGG